MLDERQETTSVDAVSEAVALGVLEDSFLKKLAGVQVIRRVMSLHSTPLPDAETLEAYAQLIPNGADRIMSLVEHEAAHRRRQESAGHWMAFILTLALASGGVCLGLLNHDWLAAALVTTTIGAVVATLVVDRKSRRKNDG